MTQPATAVQGRSALLMLNVIAQAAGADGTAEISIRALKERTGIVSDRYASMVVNRLVRTGAVHVERRAGRTNIYRLPCHPRSDDQGLAQTPDQVIRGEMADPRSGDQGLVGETPDQVIRGSVDPRSGDQGLAGETPDQVIGGSVARAGAVISSRESLEQLKDQPINRSAAAANNARAREAETDQPRPNVFALYESAIGGTITPLLADELKLLAQEYPEDWLRDAFREMALSGARSLKYVTSILLRWRRDGKGTPMPSSKPQPAQQQPAKPVDPGMIQRQVPQTQSPAAAKQRMIDALALLKPVRVGNG